MNRVIGYQGKGTASGWELIQTQPKAVISSPHYEGHEGNAYWTSYSIMADSTDVLEMRIETTDSLERAHMEFNADSALASTLEIWFGTTKTDVLGNRITPINRDMESSNTSSLILCHTPGGTQAGTANIIKYIGSMSLGGRTDIGGAISTRGELILARETAILIRMTSRADNNSMDISLDWYHHALQ